MEEYDIYFNKTSSRYVLGHEGLDLYDGNLVFLCCASPEEIDAEVGKRESVNLEFRFAFYELDINALDGISGMFHNSAALLDAAASGNEIAVEKLLNDGADPNFRSNNGMTAVMIAARYGYESRLGVVELLVDAGADLSLVDPLGLTAFDYANEVRDEETWRPYIADLIHEHLNADVPLDNQPALSQRIDQANFRAAEQAPVRSVAHFAENDEIENTVLQSDALRAQTLETCYTIPGYSALPIEDKNNLYDLVRKSIALSHDKEMMSEPER